MKVLDRTIASEGTLRAISESKNSSDFLQSVHMFRKRNRHKIFKTLKKRQVERKLFLMLVQEKEEQTKTILTRYWEELLEGNEKLRFSIQSKEAFSFLRKVFKYNQFEKRDGSIVDRVLHDDNLITDTAYVNRLIMEKLRGLQVSDKFPSYNGYIDFPKLEPLVEGELESLLSRFFPGKAFTDDCISDDIFRIEHRDKVVQILSDLWNGQDINERHFRARLVALNKKHPAVPKADQIRPIVITSPLVKILEGRLIPKLQKYLKEELHISQVGFIEHMDIYVNIWRVLTRIKELRDRKKHVYCLFLDFSSAYNTVPHSLLFEKLKSILSTEEVQLIQAVYSRTKICLGDEELLPNVGVAQGSVISPSLFNVYAESLLEDLEMKGWNVDDLFGFADDHLIINLTKGTLRKAITLVREWCTEANIKLNPDKSGVLEVCPKGASATMLVGRKFEGIPVVQEYKYLGLILDGKISGKRHLEKLFGYVDETGKRHDGKVDFLRRNLSPLIKNISIDYRINLWQILIRPLFIPLALLSSFLCESSLGLIEARLRKSIKWFLGLSRNTPNQVISTLVKVDFKEWARLEVERARMKWKARRNREEVGNLPKYEVHCGGKWMPKELARFINLQNVFCRSCRVKLSSEHYMNHGINVPNFGNPFGRNQSRN